MFIWLWLGLCLAVGFFAHNKGRNPVIWFLFSVFTSPIIGGIVVALLSDSKSYDRIESVEKQTENLRQEVGYNQRYNDYRSELIESRLNGIGAPGSPTGEVEGKMRAEVSSGIQCPRCNSANLAGAKYCTSCGAELKKAVPCPYCAAENEPGSKFCASCGARL